MSSKVHRVRFYNPKPQPINCIGFNKRLRRIALARYDASIEIWDLNNAPYMLRFIPGTENGSVEALGWVQERLLSTGLGGALIEWDVAKLSQKATVLLTGYAAWCLDVDAAETLVAVGTEQGYINLYSVENDEISYRKLFDKQEGRIMCCKFDSTGSKLVTGSIDTIRVWNVQTGHAITRISVRRRDKEAVVWSVAVLSDNTIISGDSLGRLSFWDATDGDQIESFTTHKMDILSIAVSEDEKNLYCSGMDPTISHFVKVTKGSGEKATTQWVKNVQRKIHEHDVRALVVDGETLISVGVDGYLTLSSYPPKWVMRIPPMIPLPRSSVCPSKKLLLLRYSNHLEVWKLGSYATNVHGDVVTTNISTKQTNRTNGDSKIEQDSTIAVANNIENGMDSRNVKVTETPVKLVSIQTKKKKQLQCCEMSPSGEFIVYATDNDTRMLKLDTDDTDEEQSNISVSKILISGLPAACDRVAFAEDSRSMVAHCGGALHVLHVDPEAGATVVQVIAMGKHLKSTSVLHLLVSSKTKSGSTYVVTADIGGAIAVLVNKKRNFVHHVNLPNYPSVPTALTVDKERETLIVVYADQKILEYDLSMKKFTGWPGAAVPDEWSSRKTAALAVSIHPRRHALVFQDVASLWIWDRELPIDDTEPDAKRRQQHQGPKQALNIVPLKWLAGFHWIGDDEAVTLEVLPENIVSQLPPSAQMNSWQYQA